MLPKAHMRKIARNVVLKERPDIQVSRDALTYLDDKATEFIQRLVSNTIQSVLNNNKKTITAAALEETLNSRDLILKNLPKAKPLKEQGGVL